MKILVDDNFQGTGFFITPDGYVLTAYHCIGAYFTKIAIHSPFYGEIIAQLDADKSLKEFDIAVLKVILEHQ